MHIYQSALSAQICSLEDNLGSQLFDREGRKLLLTEAGQRAMQAPEAGVSWVTDHQNQWMEAFTRHPPAAVLSRVVAKDEFATGRLVEREGLTEVCERFYAITVGRLFKPEMLALRLARYDQAAARRAPEAASGCGYRRWSLCCYRHWIRPLASTTRPCLSSSFSRRLTTSLAVPSSAASS